MHDTAMTYRDLLNREFAARCARNPHYSLRAFARDLKFLPSRLSDVMNGRQGLSAASATHLAHRLSLSKTECQWFAASVESQHARSQARRVSAQKTLEAMEANSRYRRLRDDVFAVVADWYHFAILELVSVSDFQPTPEWIGRKLGITPAVAALAVERLISVGLLRREGGTLVATSSFVASPDEIPSEAVKRHHQQILEKSATALVHQPVAEREFSANTVAIDPADLPAIKADLKRFRRRFEQKYRKSANRTHVYCLASQFFSLTPNTQEEPVELNDSF
jgi:uncharacterized protein (TIGR02147 family)